MLPIFAGIVSLLADKGLELVSGAIKLLILLKKKLVLKLMEKN